MQPENSQIGTSDSSRYDGGNKPATSMPVTTLPSSDRAGQRLALIGRARQMVIHERGHAGGMIENWIERSWQRCLARGQRPSEQVVFDLVTRQAQQRLHEANRDLVQAAQPVLAQLAQTLAATRYFALVINAQGVVVSIGGSIDQRDARARSIARVGVDLSEQTVGTTAIGAALQECAPVWLHRGEHFFDSNSVYSCAGAPIFAPDGRCAGMLDFTGIEAPERRELLSLAVHSAQQIQNSWLQQLPYALMLHLRWPSDAAPDASGGAGPDGQLALDARGCVLGADNNARNMLGLGTPAVGLHLDDIFALPADLLWDAARGNRVVDAPLWSGLRMGVQGLLRGAPVPAPSTVPLRALEDSVIRRAVDTARGNVALAAKALGISRATVYRKINTKR